MKVIEIVGNNYLGNYDNVRVACRGLVVLDGKILTSLDTLHKVYMIPGGGIEEGESYEECCIRELKEETGYLVKTKECFLEIDEYYGNYKYISYYFTCMIIGKDKPKLTEEEVSVGLKPIWVSKDEMVNAFSNYEKWNGIDETARGLYLREYNALLTLFNGEQDG